jgi:hypothetical protein
MSSYTPRASALEDAMLSGRGVGRGNALRFLLFLFSSVVFAASTVPAAGEGRRTPEERAAAKALEAAIIKACQSLAQQDPQELGVTTVAVVPLRGYAAEEATELVRIHVTKQTPLRLHLRDDEAWKNLLSEIAWSRRREDVMDKTTIQRFGRIPGVQGIIYGTVEEPELDEFNRLTVRVRLHLGVVETGEQPWADRTSGSEIVRPKGWLKYAAIGAALLLLLLIISFVRWARRPY